MLVTWYAGVKSLSDTNKNTIQITNTIGREESDTTGWPKKNVTKIRFILTDSDVMQLFCPSQYTKPESIRRRMVYNCPGFILIWDQGK